MIFQSEFHDERFKTDDGGSLSPIRLCNISRFMAVICIIFR